MEQVGENLESVEKIVAEFFPDAKATLIYGSAGEDYIQGISDVDVLIIGSEDGGIEEKLKALHERAENLDPIYISESDLAKSNFKGRGVGRDYELHKFDLYRVKNQGRTLFGDTKVIESFPDVTLDEALLDTLPHIEKVFIPSLREKLKEPEKADRFLVENLDVLLVIARALYTIETKQYGSKISAMEYLKERHTDLVNLFESMGKLYLKQPASDEQIKRENIGTFLDLAEKTIRGYLGFQN